MRSAASKMFNRAYHANFYRKSASAKEESQKSHFFVLNKGINSGKPLSGYCPNSFRIEAENEEFRNIVLGIIRTLEGQGFSSVFNRFGYSFYPHQRL